MLRNNIHNICTLHSHELIPYEGLYYSFVLHDNHIYCIFTQHLWIDSLWVFRWPFVLLWNSFCCIYTLLPHHSLPEANHQKKNSCQVWLVSLDSVCCVDSKMLYIEIVALGLLEKSLFFWNQIFKQWNCCFYS